MALRLAAIPAGYALVALFVACLVRVLPTNRLEAAITGMLLTFGLYAAFLVCAFAARSVLRLWLWMLASGAVLGALLAFSIASGGRA